MPIFCRVMRSDDEKGDYSDAALNYKGIIRLDYAPVWFIVGLIYEKMLCATNKRPAFPEALRLLKTP